VFVTVSYQISTNNISQSGKREAPGFDGLYGYVNRWAFLLTVRHIMESYVRVEIYRVSLASVPTHGREHACSGTSRDGCGTEAHGKRNTPYLMFFNISACGNG
jgi:hypothetical protein